MAKAQSPLLGYNTNVRHKGRVFHIQTEDSGIARPHVITHLFADGGRVLKTAKSSYAELVALDDVQVHVKKLMQDQHKAMFIALRDGQFDSHFEPAPEPAPAITDRDFTDETPTLEAPPPEVPAPPVEVLPLLGAVAEAVPDDAIEIDETQFIETLETLAPPAPPAELPPLEAPRAPPPPMVPPPVRPSKITGPWVTAPRQPAPTPGTPTASSKPPPLRSCATQTLPSAPALIVPSAAPAPPVRAPLVPAIHQPQPATASAPATATRSNPGFGERLVTERSLDEVILAYLAEELDEPRRR